MYPKSTPEKKQQRPLYLRICIICISCMPSGEATRRRRVANAEDLQVPQLCLAWVFNPLDHTIAWTTRQSVPSSPESTSIRGQLSEKRLGFSNTWGAVGTMPQVRWKDLFLKQTGTSEQPGKAIFKAQFRARFLGIASKLSKAPSLNPGSGTRHFIQYWSNARPPRSRGSSRFLSSIYPFRVEESRLS